MAEKSEPPDDMLKQLIAARREEALRLQKARAEQLKALESREQAQLAALRKTLPKDMVAVLDSLSKGQEEETAATKAYVETVQAKLSASSQVHINPTHPGLIGGRLIAPCGSPGWFSPCYGDLLNEDYLADEWEGTDFNLVPPVTISCFGSGPGFIPGDNCGQGMAMSWWFCFSVPEDRNYSLTAYIPFYGNYIAIADDGWLTSKEARAEITLSSLAYQTTTSYTDDAERTVFDHDGQNINVNDLFNTTQTLTYSKLLAAGEVHLVVSTDYYVYARGGGSYASLNFTNQLMPWLYVG